MGANERAYWEEYRTRALHAIEPVLGRLGFMLDERQVHLGGERFLMTGKRDVGGGGQKLVLTGTRITDGARVVIKASNEPQGIAEVERERRCREVLHAIDFAVRAFKTPHELYYGTHGDYVISVTEYIEQERGFIEYPLEEQFFLALRALETQEGVHATTSSHTNIIKTVFGMVEAADYLRNFETFTERVHTTLPERVELVMLFKKAGTFLSTHRTTIERYSGFLTHADFVPNNLRVKGHDIFLLDYASIHFGNKYESWARFLNFMVHHNPALERLLVTYVQKNRSEEEYVSLRLMRVYKLGFLLAFYAESLKKTSGDLQELIERRITLWSAVMQAVLEDKPTPHEVVESYLSELERLRSDDEKARQKELLGR